MTAEIVKSLLDQRIARNDALLVRINKLSGPDDPRYPDLWWELMDGSMQFEQLARQYERLSGEEKRSGSNQKDCPPSARWR
jgi:hypothetical protein